MRRKSFASPVAICALALLGLANAQIVSADHGGSGEEPKPPANIVLATPVTPPALNPPAANVVPATVTPSGGASTTAAPANGAFQPGHSTHGEVFDEGPRQKAYLMQGMPKIDFPITTKFPEAQAFFNQGVGQLHGFWYFEAERSFRQVAAIDADCGMAYWGMAMANMENRKRGKGMIAKAAEHKTNCSPREKAWIESLEGYFSGDDSVSRRRDYIKNLEAIVQDNPKDIEAKAMLALQLWINGDWMTEPSKRIPITSYQAVDSLLDQVFEVNPMHPAHHFRIHLWDTEKRSRALISASLCGQTSPGVAHMWHMPGHIYSGMQRYEDAAWQQEASTRVDHAQMMRDHVLPYQIHNYAHNNEWLIRDLLHVGRVHDAIDLAKNMIELPRHPKYNSPDNQNSSAALGRVRLIDALVQYERWSDLRALADSPLLPPLDTPADKVQRSRLLGVAEAESGSVDLAKTVRGSLETSLTEEKVAAYKSSEEAETKARGDHKSEDQIARQMADAIRSHSERIHSLEKAIGEISGHIALVTGDLGAAKTEFEKLKNGDLRHEHLAQIYLRLGDKVRAAELVNNPPAGEVYPLATRVVVLAATDKKPEARAEFDKLRVLAGHADLDSPVFERLKPLAKEFGYPDDWRTPKPATDVGQRPDLATLGPFRWQPTAAAPWTLPQPDGTTVSLEQYRGKPVIVLFYLGSGCLRCVEQLKKYSPLASQFSAAGISIVAISSESPESLKHSLTTLQANEKIKFPLVSDGDNNVFRAYRAYDDFEKMALHGAFLIDGAGMIRWQDISYEPFMDANFLLNESKRLLHN